MRRSISKLALSDIEWSAVKVLTWLTVSSQWPYGKISDKCNPLAEQQLGKLGKISAKHLGSWPCGLT